MTVITVDTARQLRPRKELRRTQRTSRILSITVSNVDLVFDMIEDRRTFTRSNNVRL